MNKLTKAAIAGAAGIALLLGGAGSLAYWNSSATFSAATINAGTMTIATNGSATVKDASNNTVALIVPGDVITISQPVTIAATGDNLEATLKIDEATLLGGLKPYVGSPSVHAYAGAIEVTNLTTLTASDAASIDRVTVTITFPTTVTGTDGQGLDLTLGTLNVLLTQNA